MGTRRRLHASRGERPEPEPGVDVDVSLPPPESLRVSRFEIEGEEYALLSFPVPEPELPEELTPAECEVVKGVVRGESNSEIAAQRGVSANTIANQLRSVYAKLGVRNRRALVARCLRASDKHQAP